MENKPREPWIAGVLTFFVVGLGHFYFGDVKRGIVLFLCAMLIYIFAYSSPLIYFPIGLIIAIIGSITYGVYCIIDAVRGARVFKGHYLMKKYNRWYIYLLCWFVAVLITSIFRTTVKANIVEAYKIPAGSMRETLQVGDQLFANKLIYKISEPKRGDIIIFPSPTDPSLDFIKRVIGLGGETIEIVDKDVIINGNVLQEPYNNYFATAARGKYGPVKIPEDSLFVMGDNRDNSLDSRHWGFLKKSSVKGKAVKIYWSWDKEDFRVRWDRIGKEIK